MNDYGPRVQANEKRWLDGRKITELLIPSGYGSSRGGLTDTSAGPAYIEEQLTPQLRAAGADVDVRTIDVEKIVRSTKPGNSERIRNSRIIVAIMTEARDVVCQIIMDGGVAIILGGDHSSHLAVSGSLMATPDPADARYSTLRDVFFDGDFDALRNPAPHLAYGNGHGRTKPVLWGMGADEFMEIMDGVPRQRPGHSLFVGQHRPDQEEVDLLYKMHCPILDADILAKHPALCDDFVAHFVAGKCFHKSIDPDVFRKQDLMGIIPQQNLQGLSQQERAIAVCKSGAPMADLEGISIDTYLRLCRILSHSFGTPVSIEAAEVAPALDRLHGGRVREVVVGGILRTLGAGVAEYYIDYEPFAE